MFKKIKNVVSKHKVFSDELKTKEFLSVLLFERLNEIIGLWLQKFCCHFELKKLIFKAFNVYINYLNVKKKYFLATIPALVKKLSWKRCLKNHKCSLEWLKFTELEKSIFCQLIKKQQFAIFRIVIVSWQFFWQITFLKLTATR